MTEAKNQAKRHVYTNHHECWHSILLLSSQMHPPPREDAFRSQVGHGLSLEHSTWHCLPAGLGARPILTLEKLRKGLIAPSGKDWNGDQELPFQGTRSHLCHF